LYEWKKTGKLKTPYYIQAVDGEVVAFAGLWESWRAPGGPVLETFTILTRAAQGFMTELHERMPIILATPEDQRAWLEGRAVDSFEVPPLSAHPVSRHVNSAQFDDPSCIVRNEESAAPPKSGGEHPQGLFDFGKPSSS
jgi:putative SOS response-associated peptidase YedK